MEGTRAPVPGSWLAEPNSDFVVRQAVVDYLTNVGLLLNAEGGRRILDDRPPLRTTGLVTSPRPRARCPTQ